jgi:hypothetical protein
MKTQIQLPSAVLLSRYFSKCTERNYERPNVLLSGQKCKLAVPKQEAKSATITIRRYVVVPTAYITSLQRVSPSNTNQLLHQRVLEWSSNSFCSINCLRTLGSWDTNQNSLSSCALRMEAACSFYKVVPTDKTKRRNIPDDYGCENLRSLQIKFDKLITACVV